MVVETWVLPRHRRRAGATALRLEPVDVLGDEQAVEPDIGKWKRGVPLSLGQEI
jgi:hypothetical protein